jgi:cytochrome P450
MPLNKKLRVLDVMHRFVGEAFGAALANHPIGADLEAVRNFARLSIGSGLGAYPRVTLRVFPGYQGWKRQTMAMMTQIVAEHRASPAGTNRERDFIDVLLEGRDENGQPFSDADVMANGQMVFTNAMLYGGPAASFLLYGLLKNHDARERVLTELSEIGDQRLTLDVVEKMPALRGAVLESLRMWPIALATPRVAKETFEFEGYRIEAGTGLLVAGSVCHVLPEFFPEPEKFDVDRYAPPRNEHVQAGSPYVPFGIGLHSCVAQDLIEMMMAITVGTMLRRLVIKLDPPNYVLHRVVNPFPEPGSRFAVRFEERRN